MAGKFQGAFRQGHSRISITEMQLEEWTATLSASALFTRLSRQDCREIAESARHRTWMPDEFLFSQGQPVSELVLVQFGRAKLTQTSSNGNEALLWMSGVGEAIAIPVESPYPAHTCSARAMERCDALIWDYNQVQAMLGDYPEIRTNIIRIMSERLHDLEERFRELATGRVAQRLAQNLLRLMKQAGKPGEMGVDVSISRVELAQMTGTTLFTICRVLSKWRDEGLVMPLREMVVVSDTRRLGLVATAGD